VWLRGLHACWPRCAPSIRASSSTPAGGPHSSRAPSRTASRSSNHESSADPKRVRSCHSSSSRGQRSPDAGFSRGRSQYAIIFGSCVGACIQLHINNRQVHPPSNRPCSVSSSLGAIGQHRSSHCVKYIRRRFPLIHCLYLGKSVCSGPTAFLSTAAPRRGTLPDLEQQLSPKPFPVVALSAGVSPFRFREVDGGAPPR
jgi:hypothetical protein